MAYGIVASQVKIKVSHHTLADGAISSDKALVFVLDPPKDPDAQAGKRKRGSKNAKKDGPTAKNFGARVNPVKMKATPKFTIGWRVRFLGVIFHQVCMLLWMLPLQCSYK